jgi:hypothetical protein
MNDIEPFQAQVLQPEQLPVIPVSPQEPSNYPDTNNDPPMNSGWTISA